MDILSPQQRLRCMRANKSTGTRPEKAMGRLLWQAGVRYRKNVRDLPGKPDFSLKKNKLAIFVDGDFWHGREWEKEKVRFKANRDFWISKIERNIMRDRRINAVYEKHGWKIFRFWESDIAHRPGWCLKQVLDYLQPESEMDNYDIAAEPETSYN